MGEKSTREKKTGLACVKAGCGTSVEAGTHTSTNVGQESGSAPWFLPFDLKSGLAHANPLS